MNRFQVGSATDTGRVRSVNQDSLLAEPNRYVVADGMGGHKGGEIASALAVEAVVDFPPTGSLDDVVAMVGSANDRVMDYAIEHPEVRGMGTTLCLLVSLSEDQHLAIANVGDSRLYRKDRQGLHRMTRDHSLVESLVRDGRLTVEEAAVHPQRNILTQALGIDRRLQLDVWEVAPQRGDRFVICSDGLHGELSDDAIDQILDVNLSPQDAANELVLAACEAGGRDNVTVVVVDVVDGDDEPESDTDRVVDSRLGETFQSSLAATAAPERSALVSATATPETVLSDGSSSLPPAVTWRVVVFALAVVVVLVGLLSAVVMVGRSGFSVVTDDNDTIVILQGPEDGFLWFEPTIEERSSLTVQDLLPADQANVRQGQEFGSLSEARLYLDYLSTRTIEGSSP